MSYINSIKVGDTTYPISLNTSTIGDGLKLTNDGVLTPNIGTGLQLNKQNHFMEVNPHSIMSKSGFTINDETLLISLNLGSGLEYDNDNKLTVSLGSGLEYDNDKSIRLLLGSGLVLDDDNSRIKVSLGDALTYGNNQEINLVVGTGLVMESKTQSQPGSLSILLGAGLTLDENKNITLKIGNGLTLGSDGTLSISN